jgi:hypothetical protein
VTPRRDLASHRQQFAGKIAMCPRNARYVASGSGKANDKPACRRVVDAGDHDWEGPGRVLRGERFGDSGRNDDICGEADQLGGDGSQPLGFPSPLR